MSHESKLKLMRSKHTLTRNETLSPSTIFSQSFYGIEGFDELKSLIKKGGDVSKEIAAVIAERAALELQYAKGLQKLGAKLAKACTLGTGTTNAAWETVAEEMGVEAETHKKIGESLMEDICKPLRNMCDNHMKVKKPVEQAVDKATRHLVQSRTRELKYKVKSFTSTGEAEKTHRVIIDKRMKKSPDKELQKLEKKLNMFKDQTRKSSKKYYTCSIKSERCRQEWETTSIKSMSQLKQLEEERLKELHKYLKLYEFTLKNVIPQMQTTCERVCQAADCIDFDHDLRKVMETKAKAEAQPEQILIETYAEDLNQAMDNERRRQALTLFLYYLSQDIQSERKAVTGMQNLVDAYSRQSDYGDREAFEEARLQARQVHAMLNFLDSSHFKLSKTLASLNQTEVPAHKFFSYMERTHDKIGFPLTYLRVPVNLIADGFNEADFTARGNADGSQECNGSTYEVVGSDDTLSDDEVDDEYDDFEYEDPAVIRDTNKKQATLCKCRVLYDFNSTQSSELTVREGDEVNIVEQDGDGWWKAELRGAVGLIPESYVEVIR